MARFAQEAGGFEWAAEAGVVKARKKRFFEKKRAKNFCGRALAWLVSLIATAGGD